MQEHRGQRGRPTKCTPEVIEIIRAELAKGATRTAAVEMAGVDFTTFRDWMNAPEKYPNFVNAVKEGEAEFRRWEQNEILQSAKKGLRTLIEGQTVEDEETTTEYEPDAAGQPRIRKQVTKNRKRVIAPSATAVIFALCNRDPDNWKNRVTNEVDAKVQQDTMQNVNLSNIPDDLLEKVIKAINGE